MAFSYTEQTGDGVTTVFPFAFAGAGIGYIRESDIVVLVNGVETSDFNFSGSNQVQFNSAPPAPAVAGIPNIMIRRVVPKDRPYADFSRGNNFGQDQMNYTVLQQLYALHEMLDGFLPDGYFVKGDMDLKGNKLLNVGELDMVGRFIKNLPDPLAPQDAVNKRYVDVTIPGSVSAAAASAESAMQSALLALALTSTGMGVDPASYPYGIKLDGVTNDSAGVQSLVNELGADGKAHTVNLFDRTLYLATPVQVPPRINFVNGTIKGSLYFCSNPSALVNYKNPSVLNVSFIQSSLVAGSYALKYYMATQAGNIRGCRFENYDMAVYVPQSPASTYPIIQKVTRLTIEDNKFDNVNYFVKVEKPIYDGSHPNIYAVGDWHINNNNGSSNISNVYIEGIDGLSLHGNTFFMPGFQLSSNTKTYNVYLDYVNFARIGGNALFEAGYEGLCIQHYRNVTVLGNDIDWCGQRAISDGIRLDNADLSGTSNNNLSVVANNVIQEPSGNGISVGATCGKLILTTNVVSKAGIGDPRFYYGATTPGATITTEMRAALQAELAAVNHYGIIVHTDAQFVHATCNLSPDNLNSFNMSGNLSYFAFNLDMNKDVLTKVFVLTLAGAETAINSLGATQVNLNQPAPTTISTMTGGQPGKEMMAVGFNSNTTLAHGVGGTDSFSLSGGVDVLIPSGGVVYFRYIVNKWYEVYRNFAHHSLNSTSVITENLTVKVVNIAGAVLSTSAPAAGGAGALPATPLGYVHIFIDGVVRKIPYYNP